MCPDACECRGTRGCPGSCDGSQGPVRASPGPAATGRSDRPPGPPAADRRPCGRERVSRLAVRPAAGGPRVAPGFGSTPRHGAPHGPGAGSARAGGGWTASGWAENAIRKAGCLVPQGPVREVAGVSRRDGVEPGGVQRPAQRAGPPRRHRKPGTDRHGAAYATELIAFGEPSAGDHDHDLTRPQRKRSGPAAPPVDHDLEWDDDRPRILEHGTWPRPDPDDGSWQAQGLSPAGGLAFRAGSGTPRATGACSRSACSSSSSCSRSRGSPRTQSAQPPSPTTTSARPPPSRMRGHYSRHAATGSYRSSARPAGVWLSHSTTGPTHAGRRGSRRCCGPRTCRGPSSWWAARRRATPGWSVSWSATATSLATTPSRTRR